jgi:hypothetical protein
VAKLYKFNEEETHSSLIKRTSHPDGLLEDKIVSCMTFNKFCEENDISNIDLLCIDTEGLDCEIILSINLDKVNVKKIIWEHWAHDSDDGNNLYKTGINVLMETCHKLNISGYVLSYYDEGNLCAVKE